MPQGPNEDIIRTISAKKNEPAWMLGMAAQGVPPLADDGGAALVAQRHLRADQLPGGLEGGVQLLGEQADLRPLFAACDVFVLPSTHRSEAFGIVQLEAMAFRKPVVSTRLGTGVDWVNVHGLTGSHGATGRCAARFATALATLLVSPALRARLGAHGRRRVEQEYTTARAAEAVLAVYRELTWHTPDSGRRGAGAGAGARCGIGSSGTRSRTSAARWSGSSSAS